MIRQPHYAAHYGLSAEQIADELRRHMKARPRRLAVFVYEDGEVQVCDAVGDRFRRRAAMFPSALVGVYVPSSEREQVLADVRAHLEDGSSRRTPAWIHV